MNFKERYEKCSGSSVAVHGIIMYIYGRSSDWEQEVCWFITSWKKAIQISVKTKSPLSLLQNKFRNHIHDILRKQESQTPLDRQSYEEVGTISHRLSKRELALDDLVALRSSLAASLPS